MSPLSSRLFSVYATDNNTGKRMVAEASDLGNTQLNADISIRSEKTGVVQKFKFTEMVKDADNDIMFWEYVPFDESLKASGLKVKILND